MKKLLTITLAFCTFVVAMACGSNEPEVDGTTGATEQTGSDEGTAKGKMLVVYFSRADENWQVGYVERGNTAIMVDYIKELADVEVFEIVPEVAYPADSTESASGVQERHQQPVRLRNRLHRRPHLVGTTSDAFPNLL